MGKFAVKAKVRVDDQCKALASFAKVCGGSDANKVAKLNAQKCSKVLDTYNRRDKLMLDYCKKVSVIMAILGVFVIFFDFQHWINAFLLFPVPLYMFFSFVLGANAMEHAQILHDESQAVVDTIKNANELVNEVEDYADSTMEELEYACMLCGIDIERENNFCEDCLSKVDPQPN